MKNQKIKNLVINNYHKHIYKNYLHYSLKSL